MKNSVGEGSKTLILLIALSAISGFTIFLINSQGISLAAKIKSFFGENSTIDSTLVSSGASIRYNTGELSYTSPINNLELNLSDTSTVAIDYSIKEKLLSLTERYMNEDSTNITYNQIDSNIYIVSYYDARNNYNYYYTYEVKSSLFNDSKYKLVKTESYDNSLNQEDNDSLIDNEIHNFFTIDNDYISEASINRSISNNKKNAYNIYESKSSSIIVLNAYNNDSLVKSATGFFIREGLICTSWTFINDALKISNAITALTNKGIKYEIDGVVSINKDDDFVILKLKNEVGSTPNFTNIGENNEVLLLGTTSGLGISGKVGLSISKNNYGVAFLNTNYENIGSPLFDSKGNIVGMVLSSSVDKDYTNYLPGNIINEYVKYYKNIDFNNINSRSFTKVKKSYYAYPLETEKSSWNIENEIWNKFNSVVDIENNINLTCMYASQINKKIITLRYLNDTSIDNDIVLSNLIAEINKTFITQIDSNKKKVFTNNKYNLTIYYEMDYIIIILKEL